jgi:hypothetical protein
LADLDRGPRDRRRERLFETPASFPGLYPSTVQFIAQVRGRGVGGPEPKYITAETQAATICIKPTLELPVLRGRRHPKEKEYSEPEAFLADMRAACNPPRQAGSDAAACAAFTPSSIEVPSPGAPASTGRRAYSRDP